MKSKVFNAHGVTATLVPPVLLSAAMEMQEHLDAAQQSFASAPVWPKIRADDPRIQQHPMREKVRIIRVSQPRHQPTAATNESAGDGNSAAAPAPAKPKPRPKPMPKRSQEAHEAKGNHKGSTRGDSPPAHTSSQKGKGKEVASAENEGVVNRGRQTRGQKRRKGSNTASPPTSGAAPPQVGETATMKVCSCIDVFTYLMSLIRQRGQNVPKWFPSRRQMMRRRRRAHG